MNHLSFGSLFPPRWRLWFSNFNLNLSIGALLPLRWRFWLGRRLYRRPLGPRTFRLSWHRVIKGPCSPAEVEATQYVAKHSTVPVPKVYAIHRYDDRLYIEMAFVKGETLGRACHKLSTDQKDTFVAELKQHMSALRALPPPADDIVCSALQNPVRDHRVGSKWLGPMSHDEFHTLLRGGMPLEYAQQYLSKETVEVHSTKYRTCFTHADLIPGNILVKDGHVAAIIDWEFSGWYPEYWEFTKAHYAIRGSESEELIFLALHRYETELAAERVVWDRMPWQGDDYTMYRPGEETFYHEGSNPSEAWMEARKSCKEVDLWTGFQF